MHFCNGYFEVYLFFFLFFLWPLDPMSGHGFLLRSFVITLNGHKSQSVGLLRTSDQPAQKPLPGNTQHSQQTDIHVPGGIRTRNPSKRAAAEPRLRPGGHWDQRLAI